MKSTVQFLAKFVLVSAFLFVIWSPFSRAYFTLLAVETNAAFRLIGHDARLVVDDRGASILYSGIFPPYGFKRDIQLPILKRISIHFNLIVLIALFVATPHLPNPVRIKGIAVGVVLLSFLHVAHVYYISYLFIWDYIDWQRWPPDMGAPLVQQLLENVEQRFPRTAEPYIVKLQDYWNHFLREGAPLLVWLCFAYPSIWKKDRDPVNQTRASSRN